jgi:hypothetical protein
VCVGCTMFIIFTFSCVTLLNVAVITSLSVCVTPVARLTVVP